MKLRFRMLLLAFLVLGLATACTSPTDQPPTPDPEEEGKDPSDGGSSQGLHPIVLAPVQLPVAG